MKCLTIIIPTYNRRELLKDNLENIIPLVLAHKDDVNLYISDNASTDGTNEMIKSYLDKYPDFLVYHKQPYNITAHPNFYHAVESVDSEYCVLLGDDDFLFPNYIPTIMNLLLSDSDVGWIHYNYCAGYNNGKSCKLNRINMSSPFYKVYETGESLIYEHLHGPSFMSSNVFKRSLWLDGYKNKLKEEDCPGYDWLSVLYQGVKNEKSIYYEPPLLFAGMPTQTNYVSKWVLYSVYGFGQLFKSLEADIPGIYNRWIDFQQDENRRKFLIDIVSVSYNKKFYKKKKEIILKHIKHKSSKMFFYLSLYFFPSWFTRYVVTIILNSFKLFEAINDKLRNIH